MNMIEKVAHAIADNIAAALPAGVEIDTRYAAVAAIEAMREPDNRMADAVSDLGYDVPVGDENITLYVTEDLFSVVWQTAIDAALKEK